MYILESDPSGRLYVGSTQDVEARVARHNEGRSKSTKSHRPWTVIYTEAFETRSDAMKRELHIKSWKSRRYILELIGTSR
ncbi:GIY-YIG nuclease family protein [Candidatus Lucifugimonas marina]|uniref:GIY-YIG nuclease family protein n=1 Tax=Candidatus Lucifugimonas marina TaxID=3038979 RepID=UPI00319E8C82